MTMCLEFGKQIYTELFKKFTKPFLDPKVRLQSRFRIITSGFHAEPA
jgi:hypothetical protein